MIWNSDGSPGDLATKAAGASDRDTVTIPPGTFYWTACPDVNKGITVQGAGVGSTIIVNRMVGNASMLQWHLLNAGTNAVGRLTGIEFQNDPAITSAVTNGVIQFYGDDDQGGRRIRIDHCKFNALNGVSTFMYDILGVVDHCTYIATISGSIPIFNYNQNWGGVPYGDKSYADPSGFGTEKFLFIEDCDIQINTGVVYAVTDALRAARYVVRHCTLKNTRIEMHGTESGNRGRGARAVEIYNNVFTLDNGSIDAQAVDCRSGQIVIHDNTWDANWQPVSFHLKAHRLFFNFGPWGSADGTNVWDKNVAGGPFDTGSATSGGTFTMTDSSKNWTPNYWAGYSLKKTSGTTQAQDASVIISNDAHTITYHDDGTYAALQGGVPMSFVAGNAYQIWKVDQVLDQPGRVQGSLLSGETPSIPDGWNDQITAPCYEWNNYQGTSDQLAAHTGRAVTFASDYPAQIRSGEHYIDGTALSGYTPFTYPHPLASGSVSGDITPPVVTLDSPSGTVSGVITLSATATDDVAMAGVQFKRDGVNNIGAEVTGAGPTYTRTFDTQTVPNGNHTFTATAYDTSGNSTVSSVLTLNVFNGTTAPTCSITAPTNGATISGTISVAADASDGVSVSGVQFKCDGVNIGAEDVTAAYSASLDTLTLINGSHTLSATARNPSGNTTTASVTVTVSNGADPNNVALAANGAVATASSTFDANYPATSVNNGDRKGLVWGAGGGWNDATSGAYPDWVQIDFSGSKTIGEIDVFTIQDAYATPISPTLGTTFTLYGITDFKVQSWTSGAWADIAVVTGNNKVWRQFAFSPVTTTKIRVLVSAALASYSRIAEIEAYISAAPTVAITAPANGTTVSGSAVTVSATASDGVGIAGVQFKYGTTNIGSEDTSAPYSVTWDTTGRTNGSYLLSATARNTNGLTAVSSITVTVNNITPPTVSITAPANAATVSGTISVSATAADTVAVLGVTFKRDGGIIIGTEDTTAPYSVSLNTTLLADGTHTLVATARNATLTTNSATVTVTVSNTPPAPPVPPGKKKKKKLFIR